MLLLDEVDLRRRHLRELGAVLFLDVFVELLEQRRLRDVVAVLDIGDDVRVRRDVAIRRHEPAGAGAADAGRDLRFPRDRTCRCTRPTRARPTAWTSSRSSVASSAPRHVLRADTPTITSAHARNVCSRPIGRHRTVSSARGLWHRPPCAQPKGQRPVPPRTGSERGRQAARVLADADEADDEPPAQEGRSVHRRGHVSSPSAGREARRRARRGADRQGADLDAGSGLPRRRARAPGARARRARLRVDRARARSERRDVQVACRPARAR